MLPLLQYLFQNAAAVFIPNCCCSVYSKTLLQYLFQKYLFQNAAAVFIPKCCCSIYSKSLLQYLFHNAAAEFIPKRCCSIYSKMLLQYLFQNAAAVFIPKVFIPKATLVPISYSSSSLLPSGVRKIGSNLMFASIYTLYTPVRWTLACWAEFQTSVASRLASL